MVAHTHCEQCVILQSRMSIDEKIVKLEMVLEFRERLRKGLELEPCSKSPQHLVNLCAGGAEVEVPGTLETEPIIHQQRGILGLGLVKQNIVERIHDFVRVYVEENV